MPIFERRLHFLANGDSQELKSCIRGFAVDATMPLHRYRVHLIPRVLASISSENLTMFLNIAQNMLGKIAHKMGRADPRIDYRKQTGNISDIS